MEATEAETDADVEATGATEAREDPGEGAEVLEEENEPTKQTEERELTEEELFKLYDEAFVSNYFGKK